MSEDNAKRFVRAAKLFVIIYENSKRGCGVKYEDIEIAMQEKPDKLALDNLEHHEAISKIDEYYLVHPQLMQNLTKLFPTTENN